MMSSNAMSARESVALDNVSLHLIMSAHRLAFHSARKGNAICRDGSSWAVVEPNGNVQFGLNSLAVARAWVDA